MFNEKRWIQVGLMVLIMGVGTLGQTQGSRGLMARQSGLSKLPDFPRPTRVALRYPKLDGGLNKIVGSEDSLKKAKELGYRVREARVQVYVVVEEGMIPEISAWLSNHDSAFISSAGNIVQAQVRVKTLELLNDLDVIVAVRKPAYLHSYAAAALAKAPKTASYFSEGLMQMNVAGWHSAGYQGQGIKVGILSYGFNGYQNLIGSELPSPPKVHYQSFTGLQSSNYFGTANAEIIHDIGPESELYLGEILTLVDAVNGLEWMRSNGVNVIVSSIYPYPESPGDGTGFLADLARDLYSQGILFVAAAGNFRRNHWQAHWSDPDNDGWMNFSGEDEVNNMTDGYNWFWSPPGIEIYGALVWNEWNSPVTDLSLCAVVDYNDGTGLHVVECTEESQTGYPGQLPREVMEFTTSSYGYYGFAVARLAGTRNPDMEVFLSREEAIPEYRNPEGSLYSPADIQEVIGVAAVDAVSVSLETFSSKGPTNGPGGGLTGGRTAPDLTGYSLVTTRTFGTRAFYGTGPASMHVAGAAALIWSAHPNWTNAQVRSYLENNAIDMGPSGKDNDYGYGRLYLGNPPQSCTYSISPTSQSVGANGGTGTINVSTQSGCSWNANESLSWVSITSGSSGNGSGTVHFSISINSGTSSRNGTISVAGKTFTITQSGASSCTYSISPTSQSVGANGGTGTINVSTQSGCSWNANESLSWVSITSGSSGNGSGTVHFNISANSGTSSRNGTISVAGKTFTITQSGASGGGGKTYLVAGMAHANGAGGSVWRSTLAVTNRSGGRADLTLVYRYGSGTSTRSYGLQNGGIVEWLDVVSSLFGVSSTSAGSVEVQSTRPVIVTARTYNEGAAGTFGQFLPGVDDNSVISYGRMGILPQIKKTWAFRTNIGFVNPGGSSATVRTKLYSSSGSQLGNTVTTTIPAGQWKQENDVFQRAGVSSCNLGYASVEVTTNGATVWAYASVVDNGTGDPTTIPVSIE